MAKSRSIGGIYASLSLRDKGFAAGLKNAKKSMDNFANGVASFAKGAVLAAPAAAFAAITLSMKSAIDAGGELNDMMARTGAEGEGLFVMQRAFENAGLAASQVPSALNKMQKSLAGVNEEGEATNKAFEALGLSARDLSQKDAVAAFKDIQKAISNIQDPAQRTAKAMEIFGKSGGEMLAVLTDDGAFAQAEQQVGSLGKTLADNAAKLDAVGDALGAVGTKFQVIGAEMSVALLPQLETLAEKMNETDFQHFGQGMGEVVTKTLEWGAALATVAKYTPGGFLIGQGAEAIFGGPADMEAAKKLAAEMTKYDKAPSDTSVFGVPSGIARPEDNSLTPIPDFLQRDYYHLEDFTKGLNETMRMIESRQIRSDSLDEIWSEGMPDRPANNPRQVNAYQSKGWSLDANGNGRAIETTNSLLGKIKDILADAKKTGGLKF